MSEDSSFFGSNPTPTGYTGLESLIDQAITTANAASAAAAISATSASNSAASAASTLAGAMIKANNLSDVVSVGTARTNLGLGTAAQLNSTGVLQPSNNLSDVASVSTSRTNLGLGSAALLTSAAVLQSANNLSDLGNLATAQGNLAMGMVKLAGGSGSSVAATAFTLTAGYKAYRLVATRMSPAVTGLPQLQVSINGTTYVNTTGNYLWNLEYSNQTAAGFTSSDPTSVNYTAGIVLAAATQSITSGLPAHFVLDIDPGSASFQGSVLFRSIILNGSGVPYASKGAGYLSTNGLWTNVQLFYSTGNTSAIQYELYGLL